MGMMTAMGSGGTNTNNPGTVGGPTGMYPMGQYGFTPYGSNQQPIPPTPAANNVQIGTWDNLPQATSPKVYQQTYANVPRPQPTGEAFNNGVNSDSGIASILAGLYSSGIFNQQNTNPYAPQGTVGSFTGIPYGQQQESMFSRQGLNGNPYGGSQGQSWNPYGNYYTSSNTSAGGGNTNNNIAPPPGSTGPDALQQLSFMMNRNNTQI
jgi:hypothetical protein